jgi:hypothetical protein
MPAIRGGVSSEEEEEEEAEEGISKDELQEFDEWNAEASEHERSN